MIVTVTLNSAIDRILQVPGFRIGRTLKCRAVAVVPAGKGVNVSRCLAALGVPSVAAAFVGRREQAFYEESFAGTRVTPALVAIDGPTRVNTTILGSRGRRETHLREEGTAAPQAKRALLRRLLLGFAQKGTTFAFCGSLPPGFPSGEFARLLGDLRAAGAEVAVDASGPALRAAARAGADLLSPNEDELRELIRVRTGRNACPTVRHGRADIRVCPAVGKLLRRVGAIAVKRGAKGGLLVTRDAAFAARVKLPAGKVRNAVGAGDAFLAGFLAARVRREPDDACLRAAVAAGAAAVLSGIVGTLDPATYERLLARMAPSP